MKIIFFGSSNYVTPIIETLKNNFDLSLVITTEKNTSDAIPRYCISKNIPYTSISSFDENLQSKIVGINPEVGVVADFRLIIPLDLLNLFPKGILNIHPSLLPKYRGATPGQAAILNGDKETGVSIIKLDKKLDHGPIIASEKEKILLSDTADSLYKRLFEKGAKLLSTNLEKYLKGEVKLTPQKDLNATYTKRLKKDDGYIDISKFKIQNSKFKIERIIRAYYPWPGVWTLFRLKASEGQAKELRVKFLPEGKIQVEGKKPLSYKDFVNGYLKGKEFLEKLGLK